MFKQLKISVERIHRRVAASLDKEVNGMGEGCLNGHCTVLVL